MWLLPAIDQAVKQRRGVAEQPGGAVELGDAAVADHHDAVAMITRQMQFDKL